MQDLVFLDRNDAEIIRDAVHRILNLRAGPGITVRNGPDGITISAVKGPAAPVYLPPPVQFFPVLVVEPDEDGGADGNATTVASWAYDLYGIGDTDHENKLNESPLQPENSPARIIEGTVNRAADDSVGMAYRDTTGAIKLYTCKETRVKKVCT